jgi:PleD family two-component response regulator
VAELQADESLADALTRADERLYEAKRSGRNRVAG